MPRSFTRRYGGDECCNNMAENLSSTIKFISIHGSIKLCMYKYSIHVHVDVHVPDLVTVTIARENSLYQSTLYTCTPHTYALSTVIHVYTYYMYLIVFTVYAYHHIVLAVHWIMLGLIEVGGVGTKHRCLLYARPARWSPWRKQ